MGDQHDGHPAVARHLAQHAEDLVRLVGRQHARRLVEDQDAPPEEELLEDLDFLLLARGQRANRSIEVDPKRHLAQKRLHRLTLDVPADHGGQIVLAEDEVLGHGHARHQREMLVHHAEPEAVSVARPGDVVLLAIDQHVSGVGAVVAHHALHERALPRPVLAEDRVEGTRREPERDVIERGQRSEALRHPAHVDEGRRRLAHLLIVSSLGAPRSA